MNHATISLLTGLVLALTLTLSISGIFCLIAFALKGMKENEGCILKIHAATVFFQKTYLASMLVAMQKVIKIV